MLILDDDGNCLDVNDAARRLLAVGAGGLTGRRIDEFADPAVLGARSARWAFFLVEGHAQGECELVRADGSRVATEFTLTARVAPNRHLAVLRDVDARRAAEAERASFGEALDASDDAITACTLAGTFVRWNRGAERLYGYSALEAIGQPLGLIVPVEQAEALAGAWRTIAQGEHVQTLECERVAKDGRRLVISLTLSPITDAGGTVTGVAAVGRDITKQKHAQDELATAWARAAEVSRLKSQFITNMNHELHTPLNGVVGATGLLAATALSDEQREYVDLLRVSGDALTTVIEDILDFSTIEAGSVEVQEEVFDLRALVDDVCQTVGSGISGGSVRLKWSVGSELPPQLSGDARLLRRVLINLTQNAVKFTPAGEVTVHVNSDPDGEPPDRVGLRAEVRDTGIGVNADAQQIIFDAFSQADASTTRRYGGTGLGLALAKQAVTLLGGEIGVDSTVGEGSTFWFTLAMRNAGSDSSPAALRQAQGHSVRSDAAQRRNKRAPKPASRRVLVVEDDASSRLVAVRLIEARGLHVDAAAGGYEALEALERATYDAVFMDCEMADLDGYATTREIRRREADKRHTPIIAMTASALPGDAERCRVAGMDFYVAKPIKAAGLDYIIAQAIGTAEV